MKHIQLFEQFINEKAYQMTGIYGAKGIPGKVLFAFKKEVEKIKFEGDADVVLDQLNSEWTKFVKKSAEDIILRELYHSIKDFKDIVLFVNVNLGDEWIADTVNRINRPGASELYVSYANDFVINIGFYDDADGSKFAKKVGGMMNTPIRLVGSSDIYGTFDSQVDGNNIEIRASLFLSIDAK
jgi:hypothetical protein